MEYSIFDTHTHLDHRDFLGDLEAVIDRAKKQRVTKFIIPGADPRHIETARKIAHKYENIYFAAGTHPNDIDYFDESSMLDYLDDPKCVAIGECGLDYFRLPKDEINRAKTIAKQKAVFARHIAIANERKLPLIVHIREAAIDSLELLQNAQTNGVLHCFTGDEILLPLGDRGFYFGIGGVVTFANAKNLQECVKKIAIEKIVLETDAPYLAPVPHRGKRNEPAYTAIVCAKVAELKNISHENTAKITTKNAENLFGNRLID